MFKKWRGKTIVSVALTLLLLVLFWAISGAIAQEPPTDDEDQIQAAVSLAATVNSRISYQGTLEENGAPVNGTRDITFDFFTNDACSGGAIYNLVETGVFISDGYFDVAVDVPHNAFDGEGIWMQVAINSTTFGCEEILPVPYALSLRPGATIVGEESGTNFGDATLNVENAAPSGMGSAAGVFARTATGSAVRAESDSMGVYVESVWEPAFVGQAVNGTAAVLESGEGYGVRVSTTGKDHWDHAGYFTANWGYGLYATSSQNMAMRGESGDTSRLWQPAGNVGVVGIGQARGVYGSGGTGPGVTGVSIEDNGVYGETENEDYQTSAGVWGQDLSGDGAAVRGSKYGDAGIAVYGTNWGNTGSGVVGDSIDYIGVFGESDTYRGVHGVTNRGDHNYGLYTPDNIYSLNYHTTGAIMQVVQNGGETILEPGDLAVFDGIATSIAANGTPVIQVSRASQANDSGVAGVVYQRFNIKVVEEGERATATGEGMQADMEVTSKGPIAPGEYLLLVVQGPAQVKVEAVRDGVQPGDLLATGQVAGLAGKASTVSLSGVETTIPGTVFGKALEPLDANTDSMIYVFVTLD